MVLIQQLKDKADRYYRLARSVNSIRDIELFESLGAEAAQAAADMESAEHRRRLDSPTGQADRAAWLPRHGK
jgi:hypothetical protein